MVSIRQKAVTLIRAHADCPNHARSDVRIGDHKVVIDEPKARGGTDKGPTPTEAVIVALAGCTNVIANRVAEEMGVHFSKFSVDVEAEFDRRGVAGIAAVAVPFPRVHLTVNVTTDASQAKLRELRKTLAERCAVSVMMRAAGTKFRETWNVTKP
jgi:putative redox protein